MPNAAKRTAVCRFVGESQINQPITHQIRQMSRDRRVGVADKETMIAAMTGGAQGIQPDQPSNGYHNNQDKGRRRPGEKAGNDDLNAGRNINATVQAATNQTST